MPSTDGSRRSGTICSARGFSGPLLRWKLRGVRKHGRRVSNEPSSDRLLTLGASFEEPAVPTYPVQPGGRNGRAPPRGVTDHEPHLWPTRSSARAMLLALNSEEKPLG